MQRDTLGNAVSPMRPETLGAVDDFIEGLLAYETRAERILAAADAEPECCLANAYAGVLWMFLEAPDAADRAEKYLAAAEAAAAAATPRERLTTAVLRAWADDARGGPSAMSTALELCTRSARDHPRDLVIVKLHQYFEFNRGNAPALLRSALQVLPANTDVPYVHGMLAFGYEQCHLLEDAEAAARTALDLTRREPWAQHALGHVLLTRGEIDAGATLLESFQDTWTGLNSFMSTHLWWHLALFYLSQGRDDRVLEIYDGHCWGVAKDYSQDQIGAVSLLARLELAGIDVGERWQELGTYLAARATDTVQPFLTLQYLYGLVRAGRTEADALLSAVRTTAGRTATAHTFAAAGARDVWREVALPACEGVYAHGHGDFDTAWRCLTQALPRLADVGGSHAQRDLFDLILLDAARRSGRLAWAQQTLELRRAADPDGVPVNTALATVYAELGLAELAARAHARAAHTRAAHTRAAHIQAPPTEATPT